jgi:branched-chain amino acid transport system substrate-binding protein
MSGFQGIKSEPQGGEMRIRKCRGRALIGLFVVALILTASFGCAGEEEITPTSTPTPTLQVKYIEMGSTAPLTGIGAPLGLSLQKTVDLIIDEWNQAGGIVIGGTRYLIDMKWYDDMYNPVQGRTNVEKLINEDNVDYIVGLFGHSLATSLQIINENEILTTTTSTGGTDIISPEIPWTFKTTQGFEVVGVPALRWIMGNQSVSKFAAIGLDTKSFRGIGYYLEDAAEFLNAEAWLEYYPAGTTDFYPILNKILPKEPDYFIAMDPSQIRQLDELGYKGKIGGIMAPVDVNTLIGALGAERMEGYLTAVVPNPDANAETKAFRDKYVAKYGSWDANALYWNGCIEAIIQGIEKAQSVEAADVRAALDQMAEDGEAIKLPQGDAYWRGASRFGGLARQLSIPIHICEVKSGAWKVIATLPAPTDSDLLPPRS